MRPACWAPYVGAVELEARGGRRVMARGEDGWWRAEVELAAGEDYRFVVDGAALPDPRSRWQPEGVHGPSRALDPRAFAWTDGGWRTPAMREQVVYELHVGTFSAEGTFDGVVAHLDHLLALGVTAVELMPVAEFAGARGWGYDGVDLYAPHHAYGGPHGLQRLVDACHARGLAVILDVVYNHLGPEGNHLSAFGPYFTDRYATPWGQAPNLDGPDSQPVRDLFVDNAVMWLRDYHVDGLRLDAVHAIVDMSALHFLEELARRVAAGAGPERWLLPESDRNDPRVAMPPARGGYGHDAHWCDDVHHAVHAVLTGERQGYYADFGRPDQLATALRRGYVYAGDYSRFRRRRHGRPHQLGGDNLVACVQNHDQVGNRARGDRITETVSDGRARIAAALLLCAPFVPLLFMGQEWSASTPFPFFSSHTDPAIAEATSRGRTHEFAAFGWRPEDVPDPQDEATFAAARLRWDEPDRPGHAGMLAWYRALIRLRRARPDLTAGPLDGIQVEHGDDWLVLHRAGGVSAACNWGPGPRDVACPGRIELTSSPDVAPAPGGVRLPPDTAAVLLA